MREWLNHQNEWHLLFLVIQSLHVGVLVCRIFEKWNRESGENPSFSFEIRFWSIFISTCRFTVFSVLTTPASHFGFENFSTISYVDLRLVELSRHKYTIANENSFHFDAMHFDGSIWFGKNQNQSQFLKAFVFSITKKDTLLTFHCVRV